MDLTNAMTGITEAAKSRTPLLVLAADVAGSAVGSNFRIDQDALVRSVGAVPERVHQPRAPHWRTSSRAYRTARHGRRTVVLNLPLDVQAMEVPVETPGFVRDPGRPAAAPAAPDRDVRRPGRVHDGGRAAGSSWRGGALVPADPACRKLAEQVGRCWPRRPSPKACSPTRRTTSGICGGFATPLAAELVGHADLLVAWGCSLTRWTTRHGRLLGADTTVAQVDDDEPSLGANRPVSLGVLGDVGETVLAAADGCSSPNRGVRHIEPRRWPTGIRTGSPLERCVRPRIFPTDTTIDPRLLSRALGRPAAARAGCSPWTPATSWATRRATCPCRTPRASASPRPSSQSASGWRPRSARRSASPGPASRTCHGRRRVS